MEDISRRSFLKWTAGAGVAVALQPPAKFAEKLIPYVIPPIETRPGQWSLIATTCRECPAGCGMHVRHIDGRAIKAEGNPAHPVNQGALCARGQSSVQGLYDPDRITRPLHRSRGAEPQPVEWAVALRELGRRIQASAGGRVAVLADLQTGALAEVLEQFARTFGSERVLYYEPFNYEALRAAHDKVYGLPVVPAYRLESCDFILSLSADFLETWISPVQFAQAFAEAHAFARGQRGRLCYAGPRLSLTAANADEFLPLAPGAGRWLALALAAIIVERGWCRSDAGELAAWLKGANVANLAPLIGLPVARLEALARAFVEARGSVALAGPGGAVGPVAIETALAAALLNHAAGRVGQTVDYQHPHALSQAASRLETQQFLAGLTPQDLLIVLSANPVYALPEVKKDLQRAGAVVYLGTLMDETAELADWFLPVNSPLEAWGDYEPQDGVSGLMQPVMARLYDTRHAGDVFLSLAAAAGKPLARGADGAVLPTFDDWLSARWQESATRQAASRPFGEFWNESLRRGGVWEPRLADQSAINLQPAGFVFSSAPAAPAPSSDLEFWAWPSVALFDGRGANRGWLQEAPDPLSTLVWGSWIDLHPLTAVRLGVNAGDIVELANRVGKIEAPARITEDVLPDVAALAFGQGHSLLGRNAAGRGANAFALLGPPAGAGMFGRVSVRKTGRHDDPVSTCATQDQHHREIIQWTTAAAAGAAAADTGARFTLPLPEGYDRQKDLYPPHEYPRHRWAMTIDLDRCTGCGACAVACYAENNLGVVGAEQVRRGREMAWLRIIPYRETAASGRVGFIPLLCQQCDAAPCEPVCPVFASVHNDEGLNAQVYNRCIGTRYCSHNCPYKVRRFNFKDCAWPAPLDRQLNPDVTVRSRGVMEKCTFCIQRIREVEFLARREGRAVRDGEVKPACVQTCPSRALVFGDLMDPASRVADLTRHDPRRYHVLEELNTKPAVAYLRRVKV